MLDALQRGLPFWVVGSWGVDALLGSTRLRKDLDLLIGVRGHEPAWQLLHELGFQLAYRWEENVDLPGAFIDGDVQPTAYVLEDPSGRQVDIHVVDDRRPQVTPLWSSDRPFVPGALDGSGVIATVPVRCMSVRMQLLAHEGYELPSAQRADVAILEQLLDPP